MQLSGRRVPDPIIDRIDTAKSLFEYLITKPKPKKLADALMEKDDLVSRSNVQVFDRRYTPIDQEKALGRWKVIEEELVKRGLPVTGHA